MQNNKKVIVIMPAFNTAHVLKKTFADIPKGSFDEAILIDDHSSDNTKEIAESLGISVVRHPVNKGYGAAQKIGYKEALKRGAYAVVMLHSDNQYDPKLLSKFVEPIVKDRADVVTGSRIAYGNVLKHGMPIWKYISNIFLTNLANLTLGAQLTGWHNGYRAYSARFLREVSLDDFSDKFDFDTDILIQAVIGKYRIIEIPHKARYYKENSQISFWQGVIYGLSILKTLSLYILHKAGIVRNKLFEKK